MPRISPESVSKYCAAAALILALLMGCRAPGAGKTGASPQQNFESRAALPPQAIATAEMAYPPAIRPVSVVPASLESSAGVVMADLATTNSSNAFQVGSASGAFASTPLTLDDAIAVSLDRNSTLVTLRANEPVAHAAYHVAEIYPWNPYVQIEVLPYAREPGGDLGATTNYVLLMQTLDLAHQRKHREANASAAWNQIRWNIVQAELSAVAQTERLYFTALYQRDVRDLQQSNAKLTADLSAIIERRFNANLATPADNALAKVAVRQTRAQAALAEANYQSALLALRRQMTLSGEESITLVGSLNSFVWLPVGGLYANSPDGSAPCDLPSNLAADMASVRPDVMAAAAGVDAARAAANLARANRIPSPQAGPFYERDDAGTVFAGLRAQTNLPVWDNGKPLVNQREAEVRQRVIALEELRTQAVVEAEAAMQRYELARTLAASAGDLSAQPPDELQRLKELFEGGQATVLNVFAIQTSLLQERRSHLDLLNEVAQAAADLSLTTGLPPARLITTLRTDVGQPEVLPAP